MNNTIIKSKDNDSGQKEYTIKVYRPFGANELPGEYCSLQDLIAVGLLPIMRLVDALETMLEDNLETETEGIVLEQIRRLLKDLEDALYRYDKGVVWNVPPELKGIVEQIESIPKDKIPDFQGLIETLLPKEKED